MALRLTASMHIATQGDSVSNAGDVNGDGFDDIIIGASVAAPNGQRFAARAMLCWAQAGGFSANFN
jgi:hypothetical protein